MPDEPVQITMVLRARRKRDIFALPQRDLWFAGLVEVYSFVTPPGGERFALAVDDSPSVHGASVDLPRSRSEFLCV